MKNTYVCIFEEIKSKRSRSCRLFKIWVLNKTWYRTMNLFDSLIFCINKMSYPKTPAFTVSTVLSSDIISSLVVNCFASFLRIPCSSLHCSRHFCNSSIRWAWRTGSCREGNWKAQQWNECVKWAFCKFCKLIIY